MIEGTTKCSSITVFQNLDFFPIIFYFGLDVLFKRNSDKWMINAIFALGQIEIHPLLDWEKGCISIWPSVGHQKCYFWFFSRKKCYFQFVRGEKGFFWFHRGETKDSSFLPRTYQKFHILPLINLKKVIRNAIFGFSAGKNPIFSLSRVKKAFFDFTAEKPKIAVFFRGHTKNFIFYHW